MNAISSAGLALAARQGRAAEMLPCGPLQPTVFHQPWWLNAATDGDYAEAVVMQSGQKIGSFPYVLRSLSGRPGLCGMPKLTRWLGPAVDEGNGAACNRALRRAQITRELLAQVPPCGAFRQKLHRGTSDTLVYQELGYETSVQFTFEVAAAPRDVLWRGMGEPMRAALAECETQHRIRSLDDTALFTRASLGNHTPRDRAVIERLCQAAIERGQGLILAAETLAGVTAAAVFVVWDRQSAYCVLTARRRGCGNDVIGLLLWHAIQHNAARGIAFDLDGVATALRPECLAGFGGQISPRYIVSRYSPRYKLAGRLRSVFGKWPADTK